MGRILYTTITIIALVFLTSYLLLILPGIPRMVVDFSGVVFLLIFGITRGSIALMLGLLGINPSFLF